MKLSVVRPNPTASGGGDLKADGTVPLTANWDAGSYKITAQQLESDVATGTAPLVVASTTKVNNLNADLLDGLSSSSFINPATNGFRLSLASGDPANPTGSNNANTLYLIPYKGNQITLYDGSSSWSVYTSSGISRVFSGDLSTGTVYDVFLYDSGGTLTFQFVAWTTTTSRATALVYQDGVLVKSGDTAKRYLGTLYCDDTANRCDDTPVLRYLWNYYNRVYKNMSAIDTTNSWTYTTATVRQANNSTNNQLNYVVGLVEDFINATVNAVSTNSSASVARTVGIGVDSTTTIYSSFSSANQSTAPAASARGGTSHSCIIYNTTPGKHYLAWLEWSTATGTTTWYGDNGGTGEIYSGMLGGIWC